MPHGHSHGNSCEHAAIGIDNELEMGIQYSLYQKIDMANVECLNEELEGSGKTVFKAYNDRLSDDKVELDSCSRKMECKHFYKRIFCLPCSL